MIEKHRQDCPKIILMTGERGTGKSTLCLNLSRWLKREGIAVSGFITQQPEPHTLLSTELRSGHRYTLTHPFDSDQGLPLTHFRINPEAMNRSKERLSASFPTQVFILDEIGPLELVRGEGWIEALTLLETSEYDLALIVVRPALLTDAIRQLPTTWFTLAHLTMENRDSLESRLLQEIRSTLNRENLG